MQASKPIILDNKPALIGCTKGVLNVDGGTFILFQEADHVWGYYIADIHIRPKKKYIGIVWGRVKISATELKPMQEYYNPLTGKCLFVEDRSEDGKESISDEHSFQEVAPGVHWYSYDAFFEMQGTDKAGAVLCGIALDRFGEKELKIGKVLKMTAAGYELIQPVNFSASFTTRETEEDPYRLTVSPGNGLAPFEFSVDGEEYDTEPELTYLNPEGKKVYVKDAAGTVATLVISPENWPEVIPAAE